MRPNNNILISRNRTNDHYCRHLVNDKVLVTRNAYMKACKKTGSSKTSYKPNVIWDYPAVAVTSFDINGGYTRSNYSRAAYASSYNVVLTNKLNSLERGKKIGDMRHNNIIGHCAEPHAANSTMNSFHNDMHKDMQLKEVFFSEAKRPRTMEVIPTCQNCLDTFPNLQ